MSPADISPYFHPTQIVLVDDDINFLGNLSLQLDSDMAYLLFDSTSKALNYLEAHEKNRRRSSRERFFHRSAPQDENSKSTTLQIDCAQLKREMRSSERFAQVSVVLVDYAMPGMNGLDFCRRIDNPHIKKILFTGVATESVAVDAFNEGVIDQYIRKHERSVYTTLNDAVRDFQQQYIRDFFSSAADIFSMEIPPLLAETATGVLLNQLKKEYDLVEYYLAENPPGFVFANPAGVVHRVVALNESEREIEARRLVELGLPPEDARAVWAGDLICDPDIESEKIATWRDFAAAPRELVGELESRKWAVFPQDGTSLHRVQPSYNEFLEWLDTVAYSLM